MWCIPELTEEYIERMIDILEVYERPYNPREPVICFDEKSKQLLAHTRGPLPARPGTPERYDSEYKRKDGEYHDVDVIRLVADNLNTHNGKAFYETFNKDEAERILSRIELHHTPKHASWLNATGIEINVMDIECTGRRIGDIETLAQEVTAWGKRRDDQRKKIDWKFTKDKADEKLSKYYV